MKNSYTYLFLINDFEKKESQMIDLQKAVKDISKGDELLKMLDKCLVSPKKQLIDNILKAAF